MTDVEKVTFNSHRELVKELEEKANKNLRDGQAQVDFMNARTWFEKEHHCRYVTPKQNCR